MKLLLASVFLAGQGCNVPAEKYQDCIGNTYIVFQEKFKNDHTVKNCHKSILQKISSTVENRN